MERKIVKTIIETEEKERNRFAKDLHDGIGALLSGIKMYLNLIMSGKVDETQKENLFVQTKELIGQAVSNAREIANNIKPHVLSHFGLAVSIKSFCEKISHSGQINIIFDSEGFSLKLEDDIELIFFRIVNELINNTLKHAHAQNSHIKLYNDEDSLFLNYSDDGIGFDVQNELKNTDKGMESSSKGTVVTIRVNLF